MDSVDQIKKMLDSKVWAVVGATDNEEKYGFKILQLMRKAGYRAYAVNPGVGMILGEKCYPTLKDLPEKPEAVDLVVPARVGEAIVSECADMGILNVWLQPGANADSVVAAATSKNLNVIHQSCVMVELRKRDPYL